jgi:hypothetical protein
MAGQVVHGGRYIIGPGAANRPPLEMPVIRWIVILSLLQLVAFWKILGRMGFPPWLAIMASVPLVNLIILYYVALTPWPRERALEPPRSDGGPDAAF